MSIAPSPNPDPAPKADHPAHHLTSREKLFLGVLIVACLIFAGAAAAAGIWLPPTMLSFFLALPLGILCYAFLGGVSGSSFTVGTLKLAGSGAVVIGTILLLSGKIGGEIDAKDRGRENEGESEALSDLRKENGELRKALEDGIEKSQPDIIASVVNSAPDSPLGAALLRLFREGRGPFRREMQTIELVAVFNQSVRAGTYSHCPSVAEQAGDRPLAFRFNGAGSTEVRRVMLMRGDNLGEGTCRRLDFTVQLGCDALGELMPDAIDRCDRTGIYWKDNARIQSPPRFSLDSAILNPELVTQDQIGAR